MTMKLPEPDLNLKPVYIKLTPGSELYEKVRDISNTLNVPMTKAGRLAIRHGWMGFRRFLPGKIEGVG